MRNVSLGVPGSRRELLGGGSAIRSSGLGPSIPGAEPAAEAAAQRAPGASPRPRQVRGEVASKGRAVA